MYKASYAAGDKWFEWIKLGPGRYSVYRINGNGSHDTLDMFERKSLAKKYCTFLNDNYATEGGRSKIADMSDGKEFLTPKTYAKYRLEYLRGEIEHECISYGEIAELQSLVKFIPKDDVLLLEWAGVPEGAK